MPYTLPPQTNNTNAGANYSHMQQWQSAKTSQARQTAANALPGGTVMDVTSDVDGQPQRAHVRDRNGSIKTIMFDGNQNISHMQDGYC